MAVHPARPSAELLTALRDGKAALRQRRINPPLREKVRKRRVARQSCPLRHPARVPLVRNARTTPRTGQAEGRTHPAGTTFVA